MILKHHTRPVGTERINANASGAQQIPGALTQERTLTKHLMERIGDPENLNRAYKRVKANKGAAGSDGMTVEELPAWIAKHKQSFIDSLLDGSYQPQPIRGIEIPKADNKGKRKLGIPSVVDRLVQQAIHQILEPLLDSGLSESSFGYRPGRGAHQALKKAQEYVRQGRVIVVDLDLEKFFDRVNHDLLMAQLRRRVEDKRLLKIIGRFLRAGMMENGVCLPREEGVPQGGPLSPLMSNLVLDELDKELERRKHRFCRYVDDCNIYVRSQRAGERVLESVEKFLNKQLKLKVNRSKSASALVEERQFLGYRLLKDGKLVISNRSIDRLKDKVRDMTRRKRGTSLDEVIAELNPKLRGWMTYFQHTEWTTQAIELDGWIRRKLRCYRLKQRKRGKAIEKFLINLGAPELNARKLASSGKGWWRLSSSPPVHQAMSKTWFQKLGLISLTQQRALLRLH